MTKQKQITDTLNKFYQNPIAKVSFELLLSLSAIMFFAIFAIRPTLLTMFDLIKEIEDKRKLDQQLQQKVASLSTAQATYQNLEPRLGVLEEAIPSSPRFLYSLKLIEKVASEQELVITSMSVREVPEEMEAIFDTKNTERANLPVTLIVKGDYISIRQFVEDILGLQRTFVVDTVIFNKSEERGENSLSATITLGVPYFE